MAEGVNPLSGPERCRRREICAVVVLYCPDKEVCIRMQAMINQVDALVVVDNSENQSDRLLPPGYGKKTHLINNGENRGIATALNQGVGWADQNGFEFVLLFDQDSEPLPDMAATLVRIYRTCRKLIGRELLVGSNYYNGLEREQFPCKSGEHWRAVKMVITSGTLLPLTVYREVGLFREEFFIDAVDTDYCLRAAGKGIEVIRTCKPLMLHTVGSLTAHKIAWKRTAVSNHAAGRRYFMARNTMILVCEHCRHEPRWALCKIWYLIKTLMLIGIFEVNRKEKLFQFCLGVKDGLLFRQR